MTDEHIQKLKKNIVAIGRLLWEKELVSGLNGNMSVRVDENTILLTANGTCLGLLKEEDILQLTIDGTVKDEGAASTEKQLHLGVYQEYPATQAIIHTHTVFTNGYFLTHDTFASEIFEAKIYLGEVRSVEQLTPSVTDLEPVLELLKTNNIAVLKNHGVLAMGKDLFDCFLLIQALEDAIKVDAINRLYAQAQDACSESEASVPTGGTSAERKYKLFSREQIDAIVKIVNADAQGQSLGEKTKMTMTLAVKLNESGQTYKLVFENGKIVEVGDDDNAEFVITADENVWRAVFNNEIDPFVATTQKKMMLKGDFGKISQWYAPCSRIFELWTQVPVE